MSEIASRELRNDTGGVLRRVEAGEDVTITVSGRPVAVLRPVSHERPGMGRAEFLRRIATDQADAQLADELRALTPGTTDDLPW